VIENELLQHIEALDPYAQGCQGPPEGTHLTQLCNRLRNVTIMVAEATAETPPTVKASAPRIRTAHSYSSTTQIPLPLGQQPPHLNEYVPVGREGSHPYPSVVGTESETYLRLKTEQTDVGSWADVYFPCSGPGIYASNEHFELKFELWLKRGNNYFISGTNHLKASNGNSIVGVQFRDTAYAPQQYCKEQLGGGSSLMHMAHGGCECQFGPTIFERWFSVEISYNHASGVVLVSVDGSEVCSVARTPGLVPEFFRFGNTIWGLGWWTGHEQRVRNIEYTFTTTPQSIGNTEEGGTSSSERTSPAPAPTTSPIPSTTLSATTTPVPLCDGTTSPFVLAVDTLCVPNNIYPVPNVSHCVFGNTWKDIITMKARFYTGGLGKLMTNDKWEVWVCQVDHACSATENDRVCFTYSEEHHVFVPWGYSRHLHIFK